MATPTQHLRELWQREDWSRLLAITNRLLLHGPRSLKETAYLNYYACRARLGHRDVYGGLPSGELARNLAEGARCWDLLGHTYITLSAGYHWVMQYDRGLEYALRFLERAPLLRSARNREGEAWFRAAIGYEALEMRRDAVQACERARALLAGAGRWHWAAMATGYMIRLLYTDAPQRIPRLLDDMARLSREAPSRNVTRSVVALEQARYAWFRGDVTNGRRQAQQMLAAEVPGRLKVDLMLLLANCQQDTGAVESAFQYTALAKAEAEQLGLFAHEYGAMQLMYSHLKGTDRPAAAAGR